MQRASGQYDDLARVPRTGPHQSRGRRPVATRHWSRTVARCSRRMEPAVRSARIKSAITTGRPRNDPLLASKTQKISGSRPALAVNTLPRGTEFLDTETGG